MRKGSEIVDDHPRSTMAYAKTLTEKIYPIDGGICGCRSFLVDQWK